MVLEQQSVVFHVVENHSACFDWEALQAWSCRLRKHSNGFLLVKSVLVAYCNKKAK